MRKSTKVLILILLALLMILISLCIKNNLIFERSSSLRKIDYLTTYKDFGDLSQLDTEYSYSSLTYGNNTRMYPLTRDTENGRIEETKRDNNLRKYTPYKMITTGDEVAMLITNCAVMVDENKNKIPLDVVVSLTNYKMYVWEREENGNEVSLDFYEDFEVETDQKGPVTNSEEQTRKLVPLSDGSPISFYLDATGAQADFSITYYKHQDFYPILNEGPYIYDLSKAEIANIKKVNGYYYDIDVPYFKSDENNLNYDNMTMFTGNGNIGKKADEGFRPFDTSSNSTIYYNKNNRTARFYRYSDKINWKEIYLAEDNGGIRVDRFKSSSENNKEFDNRDIQDEYYGNNAFNANSAWFGSSCFMTNDNLTNGTMKFTYGGTGCGINYAFISPINYVTQNPTKSATIQKASTDSNKWGITKGDTLKYEITQYIPANYFSQLLNFSQIYGGTYSNNGDLIGFNINDNINNNLNIERIIIYRNNSIATNLFDINYTNNVVQIKLKKEYLNDTATYNSDYRFQIFTKLKDSGVRVNKINNTASSTIILSNKTLTLPSNTVSTPVYYNLEGLVWKDGLPLDGIKNGSDTNYHNMLVALYYYNNSTRTYELARVTKTNNGKYNFYNIPGDKDCHIKYFYNGEIYQATYYRWYNWNNKVYSSAREIETQRNALQNRFATINSFKENDADKHIVYGQNQIIKNVNTGDVYYYNNSPLTYKRIFDYFESLTANELYTNNFYETFKQKVKSYYGLDDATAEALKIYIQSCMIEAETYNYSIDTVSGAHSGNYVCFGVYMRPTADLAITNDVYEAHYMVNGVVYSKNYLNKQEKFTVDERKQDAEYTGTAKDYELDIKGADYLYNAQDVGADANRNLQAYVTYRIGVKNQGGVYTKTNKVNLWYDDNSYTLRNAYLGNSNGNKIENAAALNIGITNDLLTSCRKMEITNIKTSNNQDYLAPGEETYIYVTFNVKYSNKSGEVPRLIIEEGPSTADTDDLLGKRCIAEIASYSTIYKANQTTIPDYLDPSTDKVVNKVVTSDIASGNIDINSNPGNLNAKDFTEKGELNYASNRIENDTDKAKNIKFKINNIKSTIKGTVFEDERTNKLSNGATIGNGTMDANENKINGVTIQLVELQREIDSNGYPTGNYVSEKIWDSLSYDSNYNLTANNANAYYSGMKKSKVILDGATEALHTATKSLQDGEYAFEAIPSGDFVVRFMYGDTERTVLTNTQNEVNNLIQQQGMNAKSYNGQDYMSTLYETNTEKRNFEYFGIKNDTTKDTYYTDTNYLNSKEDGDAYLTNSSEYIKNIKEKVNVYDLTKVNASDSDAKDIYFFRERGNLYSNEYKNKKGEVLNSYRKLVQLNSGDQDKKKAQLESLKELMNRTYMVAQTGVIDTGSNGNTATNAVNLGLVERPKSQIIVSQEVSNIQIILADGKTEFNTNQSVPNLYYSKHEGSMVTYRNNIINDIVISRNSKNMPELLQVYMDDELLVGAHLRLTYKILAKNISEINYTDKVFYYTGKEYDQANNIEKVKLNEFINYTTNELQFDETDEVNQENAWKVVNTNYLTTQGLVNSVYKNNLNTYNKLLVTDAGKTKYLVPEISTANTDDSSIEITLRLKAGLEAFGQNPESMVYNNLIELVDSESKLGRRHEYSIPGNQEMADQTLGNDSKAYTALDVIQPAEIDADSSQKTVILPPLGQNRNYLPIIISSLIGVMLISVAVVLIKKYVIDREVVE